MMKIYVNGDSIIIGYLSGPPTGYTEQTTDLPATMGQYAANGGIDALEIAASLGIVADAEISQGEADYALKLSLAERHVKAVEIFKTALGGSLTALTASSLDLWRDTPPLHLEDNSSGQLDVMLGDVNGIYQLNNDAFAANVVDYLLPGPPERLLLMLGLLNDIGDRWIVNESNQFEFV